MCVLIAHSYLTLCYSMGYSPPVSSVHGILQARILEWVVIPFSRGTSQSRDGTRISCVSWIRVRLFTNESLVKCSEVKVAQSCPTLCGPMWALNKLLVYFGDKSIVIQFNCKYFLPFCRLSLCFVYGFFRCAKSF